MRHIFFLLLLFGIALSDIININEDTNSLNITSNSKVFIDKTKSKTFADIKVMNKEFLSHNEIYLNFGYIVQSAVWVKIELKNESSKNIKKVLEYTDPLVSKFFLYDSESGQNSRLQGVTFRETTTKNLNNYFTIDMPKNTTKIFYVYITSEYASVSGSLKLWNEKEFFDKESMEMIILTAFFASMVALLIYNLFLFIFSRDKIYLYYVLYLFTITWHHSILTAYFYTFLTPQTIELFENNLFSIFIINSVAIASILFTKEFLHTEQYKKINITLNILLWVMIIAIAIFAATDSLVFLDWDVTISYIIFLFILSVGWYALFKKNKNAKYYVVGWGMVVISIILAASHHLGIYPFRYNYPYLIEILFLGEAFLFSIVLAYRLKRLQIEKLHSQKDSETKEYLLKELNHRIKNNLQIISSFITILSINEEDSKFKRHLNILNDRVFAISSLHKFFYEQKTLDKISTKKYFMNLIENLKYLQSKDTEISYSLDICEDNLGIDKLTLIGIIINELITNSIKYAFKDRDTGDISISLKKDKDNFTLHYEDNGIGFDIDKNYNKSIGVSLIKRLATKQLNGLIDFNGTNGAKYKFRFKEEK